LTPVSRGNTEIQYLVLFAFFDDLADRSAHSRIPNLLPTNQTALDRLPQSLSNEVPFHRASLDQVENRAKGSSELEALSRLHVARRQIGIVEYENTGRRPALSKTHRAHQQDGTLNPTCAAHRYFGVGARTVLARKGSLAPRKNGAA
jgi:hypothetical protein